MLVLAMLCCGLVCLAAGLATAPGAAGDRRALALTVIQLAGGALLGWLTGWLLGLTPAETAALALVGAAPGSIAANPLVTLAGGDLTLAHAATAVGGFAGIAAVVAVCALAGAASPLTVLVLAALLPLGAGIALRDGVPPVVHRLAPILAGLALAVMIGAGLFLGTAGAALWPLAGGALVLAVALTVLGHAAALSQCQAGPADAERRGADSRRACRGDASGAAGGRALWRGHVSAGAGAGVFPRGADPARLERRFSGRRVQWSPWAWARSTMNRLSQ